MCSFHLLIPLTILNSSSITTELNVEVRAKKLSCRLTVSLQAGRIPINKVKQCIIQRLNMMINVASEVNVANVSWISYIQND